MLVRLVCAVITLAARDACAQIIRHDVVVTNGPTGAAVSGNTLYLWGAFTRVGTATGGGAELDAVTAIANGPVLAVNGSVFAVVSDGAGGWFIGGDFTAVGDVARARLAHVLADGSLSSWDPGADDDVRTLARDGATVYAGGLFAMAGGAFRKRIAALDATTGAAIAWDPSPDGPVNAIAISGSTVYVAGDFAHIGGETRTFLAAISASSGLATGWDPGASAHVSALAVDGTTIYAGGSFFQIGGQTRTGLAALDSTTALASAWNPSPTGAVSAVTVAGNIVYVGGAFNIIGGQLRRGLAAVSTSTGLATSWNPALDSNAEIRSIAVDGTTVYFSGPSLASVGGQPRHGIAAADATTGAVKTWDPDPGSSLFGSVVECLAADAGRIYAGGEFGLIGGHVRNHIAAVDLLSGDLTNWDPDAGDVVNGMVVNGTTVYVAGAFSTIGGQIRHGLAALDATTGLASSWDPDANNYVSGMWGFGSTIYVSGVFTAIHGQPRNRLAAIDKATGLPTAWDPASDDVILTLRADSSTVYVGGFFNSIGGQPRRHVAALDATTGLATPWDPSANGFVFGLAASGSIVYVGGTFDSVGAQQRFHLAAVDAVTGLATQWNPNVDGPVSSITPTPDAIYVGGSFNGIGGVERNHVAALDPATANVTAWYPNADDQVGPLIPVGASIIMGGRFRHMGGSPRPGLAIAGDLSTPAQLALLSARASTHEVELVWFAAGGAARSATVYRRDRSSEWRSLGGIFGDGQGRLRFVDVDVRPGERYGYRLGVLEGGRELFLGETSVDIPFAPGLALGPPRPNPADRDLTIAFSLPDAAPARLEVLDVSGRIVMARDVGSLGAGSHVLNAMEGRSLTPGVYVIRLTRSGQAFTTRAAVIR